MRRRSFKYPLTRRAAWIGLNMVSSLFLTLFVGFAAAGEPKPADSERPDKLPPHVADVREALLSATRSGNAEDLHAALEMGSTLPDFGIGGDNDLVSAVKASSADGTGAEFLAALAEVLSLPHAEVPLGKDIENNVVYVWPYLAERPLTKLTPPEKVDLLRLVETAKAKEMQAKDRWLWWRLEIAADGTWLSFKRAE